MSYRDDVGNLADKMWMYDEITGRGGGGGGKRGCSEGFWKFILVVVLIYSALKFIFG